MIGVNMGKRDSNLSLLAAKVCELIANNLSSQSCKSVRLNGHATCIKDDHKGLHFGYSRVTGNPMSWGKHRA